MTISTRAKCFTGLSAFVMIISGSVIFNGCKPAPNGGQLAVDTLAAGKQLVSRHCTGCHELVPANLLTKDVWLFHTLPSMAKYEGIATYGSDYFKSDSSKGMSLADWQTIVAYYKKAAPVALDPQKRPELLSSDWAGFSVKLPGNNADNPVAFTSMVAVNSGTGKIYSSDLGNPKLYEWDNKLIPKVVASLPSAAVSMNFEKNPDGTYNGVISCVGQLEPIDYPNGRVLKISLASGKTDASPIETDLLRPLQTSAADFNKDGLTDYVISAQGNLKGNLVLMKQNADHTFARNILKDGAGAVQTIVGDFNNDGWPDIMALFSSVNEGVYLFTNNTKGGFSEKALLKFPPVYGLSSFQLADLDHDGKPELILTSGYNYRDSRILKPYHGLYIYTNTGNWKLKQSYFYPINGCTKAIAADFDGDGDMDIVTSAYFADLKNNPGESFIYFEHDKGMHFKPHAVPVSKYGRWFSMDAGDYNGDGKPDVVLGNYSKGLNIESNVNTNNNQKIPLIVLQNNIKK